MSGAVTNGRRWTKADDATIRRLTREGKSQAEIALILDRTEGAVRTRIGNRKRGEIRPRRRRFKIRVCLRCDLSFQSFDDARLCDSCHCRNSIIHDLGDGLADHFGAYLHGGSRRADVF